MKEDARTSGEQIPAGEQWRLRTLISSGGFSAYQMVFGTNPADSFRWKDKGEDLTSTQDFSPSGKSAQRWKPRMMEHEEALREIANAKLRRLLA